MKTLYATLLVFAVAFIASPASAQKDVENEALNVPMFSAAYAYQFPGGDMAEQFGSNSVLGGDFKVKFKSGWIIGADYSYLFGPNIKNRNQILKWVKNSEGELIDQTGGYAAWQMFERGFYSTVKVGKLFPSLGHNPNSGPFFTLGFGYMQHKIRFDVENNTVPQLNGDYKRGYDRLRGGFAAKQFIGYLYMGNTRVINFYAGIEIVEGWTKDLRDYSFDEMKYNSGTSFDLLIGVKVGWFIPIHGRAPEKFYYN
ncbi:MAG: hypothetical protein U5Q03_16760 [Bacteroidota bacterium]|nr:hypothetical protein [Bacteroidota bacterium]